MGQQRDVKFRPLCYFITKNTSEPKKKVDLCGKENIANLRKTCNTYANKHGGANVGRLLHRRGSDECALMYAVMHCFTDLIGFVPNAAANK